MYDSIAGVNYQEITLCMTALLGPILPKDYIMYDSIAGVNYQEITLCMTALLGSITKRLHYV